MNYVRIAEKLKDEFIENPIDFVTEFDLQAELAQLIKNELIKKDESNCLVEQPELKKEKSIRSYKREYFDKIQYRLKTNRFINRVHTEVSITKGRRIDVVVFKPRLKNQIEWIGQGSKRFHVDDIETAIELKFIKNKHNFPIKNGEINLKENKLASDIEDLGKLKETKKFLLIFSNNNFLYHNPTVDEEKRKKFLSRSNEAKEKLKKKGKKNRINILYVHPRGWLWINKND